MGCGGSVQTAAPLQKEDLEYARNTESTVASNDEAPSGDSIPWKEVVKVDSQRSGATTALCTPALEAVEVERSQSKTDESFLSAESFDPGTGVPDMENSKLNANLRKFAVMLDAEGTVPEDFPRLARLIIRKQARLLDAQGLKVSRCFSEDTDDTEVLEKQSTPLGSRRLTEPVLADERFKHIEGSGHGICSSQELQARLWRSWQEKDPSLVGRLRRKEVELLQVEEEAHDTIASSKSAPAIVTSTLQDAQLDTFRIEEEPALTINETPEPGAEGTFNEGTSAFVEALQTAVQQALYQSGDGSVPDAWNTCDSADLGTEWQRRENVLFVLDWDDTIFPTTWLTSKPWFRAWIRDKGSAESMDEIDPEDLEHLNLLDLAAHEFLTCVKRVGTPVCITLSQRPWVEMSMKAFMPRLAQLWEETGIPVHYAVEEYVATPSRQGCWCQKPCGSGGLEGTVLELHLRSNRKRKVMERVLRRFYRNHGNRWLHAISLGDGLAERDALQEISMCHQNPRDPESGEVCRFRVKTIQMLEDPSCGHLRTQLEVLRKWAHIITGSDQDVDAVFSF